MRDSSEKFFIDMKHLMDNGKLTIKYKSTKQIKKTDYINNDTREVVLDIIHNRFNKKIFNNLKDDEKIIIENFIYIMGFDDLNITRNHVEDLYNEFQILKGSIEAGNNSEDVKRALKHKIIKLVELKRLSSIKGMTLMYELSLN